MSDSEYTHVVQAKGKEGRWLNFTQHSSEAAARDAAAQAGKVTNRKADYRVVPFGQHKNPDFMPETSKAKKPAAKKTVNKTNEGAK